MSSLDLRSALLGCAATTAVGLSLGLARQEAAPPAAPPVGRYQVAIGDNLSSTVLLDTATGVSWRIVYEPQSDRWAYDSMGHPDTGPVDER